MTLSQKKKRRFVSRDWQGVRERARNNPQHQALAKQHCSRGTNRNMYLALDRLFITSGDPEMVTIETRNGPRLLSRGVFRENNEIRLENKKIARSRRKSRAQCKTRANQRRIKTRGKHRR